MPAVPFYVLCGSLGAGKTTFLMRLLEHWRGEGRRVGVLMNEAGEVSIDGPRAGTLAEQVLNLAGGCICCDTKEDLTWGIAQLVKDYESDLIVLECSGMADPAEVVDAVTDVYVARLARLERVVALLHPVSIPEGTMMEIVTRHAIRYADDLILNKRDLYIPGHWEQFKAAAVKENPHARLWETTHARMDIPALLDPIQRKPSPLTPNVTFDAPPGHGSTTSGRASHHPMVVTMRLPRALNRAQFLRWVKHLPAGVERAKGFFRFSSEPELQEFQFFPPRVSTIAPVMLLDEPDHVMILIGRDYDQESCRSELLACLADKIRPVSH
ncbi:MAG: CobW family GTP-binding protein [Nitrospiraceae bacterium]